MIYTFGPSGSIQIYLTLLVNGTSIKVSYVPNSATMLLVFCTIRMYAVSFTVIAIFPIFLERCFATLFVQDYEKEKRTYIFFGIILFLMLFCSICPFVILIGIAMERTTTLYIVTPCYMIAHITHHLAHQLLKKYNQQIVAQISEHPLEGRQYTLATRFQLKENLRALDLLHRMLSVSTIVNVYYGTFIVITFTFFDSEAPGAQILMAMIELMLAW
ncbi:unnamed protein product, partial [Mesorhabditis belari]|uniref:Gustatory receptor n=1 Tax=Mesorhabditis belari TaxID=2138241 RepID=A0AAF3J9I9_9BILA